ncbi:MAG: glycerophosphodiester phosphodiesterase [Nocardioidaceae bacterium]|nr:glycerophosphodiester phosphodiesterase [Nocardioidaceae bacterium]
MKTLSLQTRRTRAGAAIATVVTSTALLAAPTTAGAQPDSPAAPAAEASRADTVLGQPPLVIAHRGASGYRPEHTLAAYKLAIQLGADYVEPDLVSTKDGVLVARHENEISTTTDVADHPEFADRHTTKTIDGVTITGWFTEDFTLAELKTLRAVERLPTVRPANTRYNGLYQVPTFDEVLALVRAESAKRGRTIGVYPETKHPTYFRSIHLALSRRVVRDLRQAEMNRAASKVFIQSFETSNLRHLDTRTNVKLVQLINSTGAPFDLVASGDPRTYADLVTAAGLREIATYADGIGPNKDVLIPRDAGGFLTQPTGVVSRAHRVGLVVHAFTFRDENQFLPADYRVGTDPNAKGDAFSEYARFFDIGVDGVFADYTDTAIEARDLYYDEDTERQAN